MVLSSCVELSLKKVLSLLRLFVGLRTIFENTIRVFQEKFKKNTLLFHEILLYYDRVLSDN
ncbi:MAG: hypothetical protein DCC43_10325 [Candidatus Brocadia sp.]|nr:hypothetical protein [Candidatus Brocadia sp. AMX3]OQZ00115.1 MAG: hypothetical protein B6D35_07355 [Candidatus Brocadia sp. UTAMX2]RIJ97513.1 MAG: hypothetical protein DCC43_10325 [Candidatus Brocadia sp.]